MGVDQDRRDTARARRALVIDSITRGLDAHSSGSPTNRLQALLDEPRVIVANADIDGLASSMMLASVTHLRIGVLVDKTAYRLHPALAQVDWSESTFLGVDVFSPRFPNLSNHPVLFGGPPSQQLWGIQVAEHDQRMHAVADAHPVLNPSHWAGIAARLGSKHPNGMDYKYPFGTAQVLLAVLEVLGRSPRFFDRQYLPWLIANCDGGIETIRTYAWNAETWWSALAAAVGPSSMSEALYRLATQQRPSEFMDADRRLRWEEPDRSRWLNSKWNLTDSSPAALQAVVTLISDLSGWPDPFRDGVSSLPEWQEVKPERGVLPVAGLTKVDPQELARHVSMAGSALHMNFSKFRERGTALGWMSTELAAVPSDEVPTEETDVGDQESTPDLGLEWT
jgi:hypothetical protein